MPKPKKVDGIFSGKVSDAVWGKDKASLVENATVEQPTKVQKRIFGNFHFVVRNTVLSATVIMLFAALLAGSAFAQERMYEKKVYPGVVIWGAPVGGKTFDQVQEVLTEKIKEFKVTIKGPDQSYSVSTEELGVYFDTDSLALSAYSKGRTSSFSSNLLTRVRLLASGLKLEGWQRLVRGSDLDLPVRYNIDEEKFNSLIKKVVNNINIPAQDSKLLVENGNTKLIPAVFGREVDSVKLKDDLKKSINSLNASEVSVKTTDARPAIIDEAAEDVRIQTESIISRPVVLSYQGKEYKPNKETIGSWISYVKPAGAESYNLVLDKKKMSKYLSFLDSELSIYPITRKVRIENGVKSTVTQEGKDGILVDQSLLARKLSEALPIQSSVNLTIPMYTSKFKTKYDQVLVANWNKYIEIDLSNQRMTAYEKGGKVVGSWSVTTGKNGTPTPVGTWLVHGKSAITRMTGGTPGYDYYDLPNVHWVTWFKGGGYSIHEAYWRSSFGGQDYVWNGSHGCVNSPLAVAKYIYDWAPIGTPVIVRN